MDNNVIKWKKMINSVILPHDNVLDSFYLAEVYLITEKHNIKNFSKVYW